MAGQPVPVEACAGWLNTCTYCNKRFSSWIPIEEEDVVDTIPTKPGVFMFSLNNKREKEIVAIGMHKENIQLSVMPILRDLRRQISQKRLKETKASIFFRYVIVEDMASKETCSIYAHWQNYGILPRMTLKWPGRGILKNSEDFEYFEENQKWCYPLKDPVWRKQKVSTVPQGVSKCKGLTENCSYCDGKFTIWLPAEEAINRKEADGGAPERTGIYMYTANKQGKREIIKISTNPNIREDIVRNNPWIRNEYSYRKARKYDFEIQVRWMTVKDLKDTDSCFMYAHFLNCGAVPLLCHELPGVEILESSEDFIFRHRDKQWCHDEGLATRPKAISKTKERRDMLRSILEESHSSAR